MKRLLILFSLLLFGFYVVFGEENVNETGKNFKNLSNSTANLTEQAVKNQTLPTNQTQIKLKNQTLQTNLTTNQTIPTEELIKILQQQIEDLRKQNEILQEEINKLRKENLELRKKIRELEEKPVTWEDIEESIDTTYAMFTYWTGWLWPLLTAFLILRYRKQAREEEELRIKEAAEQIVREKQREWYNYQIKKKSIEKLVEDESEAMIFRSLGIYTVNDLLNKEESEIIEAFKQKYQPTADLLEHFKNRLKEIKENMIKEIKR